LGNNQKRYDRTVYDQSESEDERCCHSCGNADPLQTEVTEGVIPDLESGRTVEYDHYSVADTRRHSGAVHPVSGNKKEIQDEIDYRRGTGRDDQDTESSVTLSDRVHRPCEGKSEYSRKKDEERGYCAAEFGSRAR